MFPATLSQEGAIVIIAVILFQQNIAVMITLKCAILQMQCNCYLTCPVCLPSDLGIEAKQIVGTLQKRLALLTGKTKMQLVLGEQAAN